MQNFHQVLKGVSDSKKKKKKEDRVKEHRRGDPGGQTAAVAELILLGRHGQPDGFPGLSSVAGTWVLFVGALYYRAHPHNKRLLLAWSQRGREQPPSPALVPAVAKSPPSPPPEAGSPTGVCF